MKIHANWRSSCFVTTCIVGKLFYTRILKRFPSDYNCNSAFLLFWFFLVLSVHVSEASNSKLSETVNDLRNVVTKKHSFLRHLQQEEDLELDDLCQELLLSSEDIGCMCTVLSTDDVSLSCPDSTCLWCDEDVVRCGILSHSVELGSNGTPPDYITGQTMSFEYTTGETVAVTQLSCDVLDGFPSTCTECVAYVNGEECTSCSMCEDGFSYFVDCENLATNSSFSECLELGPDYGIFQGLNFDVCKLVQPTNDVCSNSTLLQFGKAVIGRTNGATEDSISSTCKLASGSDVWYTVEGSGDTIVAATCSSKTMIDTTIDVFSGPDSCVDLQCNAAAKSACAAGYIGGTLSWPSERLEFPTIFELSLADLKFNLNLWINLKFRFWMYQLLRIRLVPQVSYRHQSIIWDLLYTSLMSLK
jgi:hypothetical protein